MITNITKDCTCTCDLYIHLLILTIRATELGQPGTSLTTPRDCEHMFGITPSMSMMMIAGRNVHRGGVECALDGGCRPTKNY